MMSNVFDQQKKSSLSGLDHSKKGTFDAPIHDLIVYLNSLDDYFTTSSCSGRIIVFAEGDTKKKGCHWLLTSHDKVELNNVIEALDKNKIHYPIKLKYESFILHVQCRSLECAQQMLQAAIECGYRNSGLVMGKKKKIMLAVRSTHGLEVPLMFNEQIKVSEEYLAELVVMANNKMAENFQQIDRFFEKIKTITEKEIT